MTGILQEIRKDLRISPYFLSPDLENHVIALEHFTDILTILIDIDYCTSFMSEDELEMVRRSIVIRIDESRLLLDSRTFMKWVDWLRYRAYYYRKLYLENEHYEQAGNLERIFLKIFKKKHII